MQAFNATATDETNSLPSTKQQGPVFVRRIIWRMVIALIVLHIGTLYGLYLMFTSAKWETNLFSIVYLIVGGLGVTAGNHRLWTHKSYKARFPLKVFLCILSTVNSQKTIFTWCREHRMHHKYSGTNADPYSINRGFFFAHMGWLMCNKHPEYKAKLNSISVVDLLDDPVIRFEKRFNLPLALIFSFFLPIMTPVWLWNETFCNAFFIAGITRLIASATFTFNTNSVAHMFGYRPFDESMDARENALVHLTSHGEGSHNYHHAVPWDYASPDLDPYVLNITAIFIRLMNRLGLAYDLKTATADMIQKQKLKAKNGIVQYDKHSKTCTKDSSLDFS